MKPLSKDDTKNMLNLYFVNLKPSTADRKSTRLNSSHANISYAVFCLKKKKKKNKTRKRKRKKK